MSINKIGQNIVILLEKFLFLLDEDKPIHALSEYSFLSTIESNYLDIKTEIENFNQVSFRNMEDLSAEQQRIVERNKWKTFFLRVAGKDIERNAAYFPLTMKLLNEKSIKTVFFSIMEPNTHITPHRGVYKGFLRYHLGLIMPNEKNKTAIKIGDAIYYWEEGKAFLFDDTFEHEAWNKTNEQRIILLIDIERKFTFPFNLLNKLILSLISISPLARGVYKKA